MKQIWIGLLLCFMSEECGSSNAEAPIMTEQTLTMQNEDARLVVHVTPESDTSLRISYRVENKATQPLYLFNRLYEEFNQDMLLTDKNLVYVYLDNRQALLCKAIAPVPAGVYPAVKIYPCVTKIQPHGQVEESFLVHLPLSLKTPYSQPVGLSKRIVYKPLTVGLGYFVGTAFTERQEREANTSDGPAIRFDAFTYENQKWLKVGPLNEPVMVFEVR